MSSNNDFVIGKVYERIAEFSYVVGGGTEIESGQRILILQKEIFSVYNQTSYYVKFLFNGKIYNEEFDTANWENISD